MRITARQLRQIIKEELTRSMNEERLSAGFTPGVATDDEEMPAMSMPTSSGMSDQEDKYDISRFERMAIKDRLAPTGSPAERLVNKIEGRVMIEYPDLGMLASNPKVKAFLKNVAERRAYFKKGTAHPSVPVIRGAILIALQELYDMHVQRFGYIEKVDVFKSGGGPAAIAKIKSGQRVSRDELQFALAAAKSNAGPVGDTNTFDNRLEDAVYVLQYIAGNSILDGIIGEDTLEKIANPTISYLRSED